MCGCELHWNRNAQECTCRCREHEGRRASMARQKAPTPEDRIALALSCLEPVYRLAAEAEQRRRWWRRPSGPALGTLILAERVRRALTEDAGPRVAS